MKTVLFAGAAFALAATAFAQARPGPAANSSGQDRQAPVMSSSGSEDIEFVFDAAKGGMAEVELGKLAAERAKNEEVKKFAQRMVDDHAKAGDELKSIAEKKGIKLPQEIDAKDRALIARLQKLNGAAFDRAYMQAMVGDHVKDVNEFKKEANSGRDPQVKSFASTTLPTLEEHLQHARQARTAATSSTAAN
jgi:putative membrane protein